MPAWEEIMDAGNGVNMTKRITDLEGRLDAALKRADLPGRNLPKDCGDGSCQDCANSKLIARMSATLKKQKQREEELTLLLKDVQINLQSNHLTLTERLALADKIQLGLNTPG